MKVPPACISGACTWEAWRAYILMVHLRAQQCPKEDPWAPSRDCKYETDIQVHVFKSSHDLSQPGLSAAWPLEHKYAPRAACLTKHRGLSAALPTDPDRKRCQEAGRALCTKPQGSPRGDQWKTTQCLAPALAPGAPNTRAPGCQHPSDSQRGHAVPNSLLGPLEICSL